jgi:signal peptidase II
MRYRLVAVSIAVVGLALDQTAKALAIANLDPAHPVPLMGGLITLQLIRNSGAAFSMGESFTPVFTVVAIAALVAVLVWALPRLRHLGWAVTTGLLLAGIAGNLTDRLFREPAPFQGHVVDFIQLPYFAIFNVADMCITAAAVLVVWLTMIAKVNLDGTRPVDHAEAADG